MGKLFSEELRYRFSLRSSSYSPVLWLLLSTAEVSVSMETGTGKGSLLFQTGDGWG
jgi:hypothetical protein